MKTPTMSSGNDGTSASTAPLPATEDSATEETPLVADIHSTASNNDSDLEDRCSPELPSVLLPSDTTPADQLLWEELDQPWPATFERSISLLASPVVPPSQAALYTMSPKPGSTPLAFAIRTHLDRGFYSPDPHFTPNLAAAVHRRAAGRSRNDRSASIDATTTAVSGDDDGRFQHGLSKTQSLDFAGGGAEPAPPGVRLPKAVAAPPPPKTTTTAPASTANQILKTAAEHQRKAEEAKAYRAKILQQKNVASKQQQQQQQQHRIIDGSTYSPGYAREMASIRIKDQRVQQQLKQQQQQPTKQKQPNKQQPATATHSSAHDGHHASAVSGTEGKATLAQCAFNLANILMGIGLLGLPFVFAQAGWWGGTVSLLVFGTMAWRTSLLIGRELNGDPRPSHYFDDSPFKSPLPTGVSGIPQARMLPPLRSFPAIARTAFGSTGCLLLSSVLYFELFSCLCIFFVMMGDHLHELFPTIPVDRLMALVALLSLIPTVILRTPTLLSYLSMIGTFATMAVVVSVIVAAVVEGDFTQQIADENGLDDDSVSYRYQWRSSGLVVAVGMVAYCFSGHAIVPSIYTSMARPQDFDTMVTATFVVVLLCCFAVAISGYYMFGNFVSDQVTLSLEAHSQAHIAMDALTWLMIMTAFSKVTLTMFPLALGMEEIVAPYLYNQCLVEAASSIIKIVLTVLALIVAVFVPSFSYLCALVGMICTMAVSVIFPAAAHLKMFGERLNFWEKLCDWIFVIVGMFMAIAGTIVSV